MVIWSTLLYINRRPKGSGMAFQNYCVRDELPYGHAIHVGRSLPANDW